MKKYKNLFEIIIFGFIVYTTNFTTTLGKIILILLILLLFLTIVNILKK